MLYISLPPPPSGTPPPQRRRIKLLRIFRKSFLFYYNKATERKEKPRSLVFLYSNKVAEWQPKNWQHYLETFIQLPGENEVVEFKKAQNGFDTQKIGEYFSALSNEANLRQEESAWLLFGIHDKTPTIRDLKMGIIATWYWKHSQNTARLQRKR